MSNVVIVRYGELALKSPGVRNHYEKILMRNISAMLDQCGVVYSGLTREWGRVFIHTSDERAVNAAANVFGVVSASFADSVDATLEAVSKKCADIGAKFIEEGESFAIRARRTGNHEFSSQDIGIRCGDAVWERLILEGKTPVVDLTSPDKEIFVEIRQKEAYVFTENLKGVGGLPLGTQGKMVALVSGGIDSPVAAWLMMKRGVEIIPIYCNNEPYADESTRQRALDCIKVLQQWAPGHPFKIYEIPHGHSLKTIVRQCSRNKTCVLCKRTMYRIAYEIMKRESAAGVITGSSLGQVASQTANNMYAELYGLAIPLYHPLIAFDKTDIINLARKIGSYDVSVRQATCCSAVPEKPLTNAEFDSLQTEEKKIDIDDLVISSVSQAKVFKL
ncbi:MAG: tRNA 4-thiouridine(8) synthase ThiI [Methanomethylovorans sp.]|jgi:thiamine biosynthesis protein ThiI|nr:tRNA 4-thiouridine(8) synthase ThiI [Methanomethylovorans sp.]